MRILIVTSRYLPHLGGLETAVHEISEQMRLSGHTVKIVTNRYPVRLPGHEQIDGTQVTRLRFIYPEPDYLLPGERRVLLASFLIMPATLVRLAYIIWQFKPDVVNLHYAASPTLWIWALQIIMGFRLVVSLHGGDVDAEPYQNRIKHWLFEHIMHNADYVTACSHDLLIQALKLAPDIQPKSTVIHNGVDVALFAEAPPYNNDRPYVLAVGQLGHHKGFDTLIEAFARIAHDAPDFDLLIAGEGPDHELMNSQIQQIGLENRIKLLGARSHQEIASLMHGCAIMVIPSRREPFGIVGLEAMAAGRPIIARRIGGLEEALADAKVTWVEDDSPTSLMNAIRSVIENKAVLESQQTANQVAAQPHSWLSVAEHYLQVYRILA